ncbi:aminoglycoside phosphotransferase family protein [Microbacterium sp. P02]|uniref:aminoglycoside phosphotransferase family protein n=1 Tax=Microbacterium sp. P02 TaxID=3366260 RepID=UPI0036703897
MTDKPASEVLIDEHVVRSLLAEQATSFGEPATDPLRKVAEGWDCEIWRWGDELAVRLPRRALAAPLIAHEQKALRVLAPSLNTVGVQTPAPLLVGSPGGAFPWQWSVVPWIEGSSGLTVPRAMRAGWARTLASVMRALHREAPADAPHNPVRGVPLVERKAAVDERLEMLRRSGAIEDTLLASAAARWADALMQPPWGGPPVWIHGDLHAANLVVLAGRLVGVVDFGDATAGDPAYDLAAAWLAFDSDGRALFRSALADVYDDATWIRAEGWAAAMALLLVAHSDDMPDHLTAGIEALEEIRG